MAPVSLNWNPDVGKTLKSTPFFFQLLVASGISLPLLVSSSSPRLTPLSSCHLFLCCVSDPALHSLHKGTDDVHYAPPQIFKADVFILNLLVFTKVPCPSMMLWSHRLACDTFGITTHQIAHDKRCIQGQGTSPFIVTGLTKLHVTTGVSISITLLEEIKNKVSETKLTK